MTGRRMGRCTNYGANLKNNEVTTSENSIENQPLPQRGLGAGFGLGRGGRGRGMGRGMGRQNRFRGGV